MRAARLATPADLSDVVQLLNDAADRLADRGVDQWRRGWMTADRMRKMIAKGETFIVEDDGKAVATFSLSTIPDPDFWTPEEQSDPALYLAKLARDKDSQGVGEWALNWALRHAARSGYNRVRLDAWASNHDLHEYYRSRGWRHLRTMLVPGRKSGALFEKCTERETMISTVVRHAPPPDSPSVATDLPTTWYEPRGATVRGVAPFLTEDHAIMIRPGEERGLWHDGQAWRLSAPPGWSDEYAAYVVEWPDLAACRPDAYVIRWAPEAQSLVLAVADSQPS
ncbi:GNAT family N-acetyltransferase [Marinactinospora rubrisoli]|uniref:GNAT family N-acetyltransferase n=1 Tax=Marinactinospora rubrisoli TaxID=2715399 RepID=A0ABW2KQC6_9ACTN